MEQLRAIQFLTLKLYLCERCLSGLCNKVFSLINFAAQVRTLSLKSNTIPWFDIEFLNANDQVRKLTTAILSVQSFYLKK